MDISENGEPIPGYRLIKLLGRGGFGEAWEALAPGDMPIAIKFIRLEQSLSESEQRELKILRKVRHAHLLDVHFAPEVDGYLLMGMPLCDQDLMGRLEVCQNAGLPGIPPEELLDLMDEAAEALDFLHGHDVIHRDIKPHNIFLVGGTAKVADFGLAKVLNQSIPSQSGYKFTPAYVAPEIVQGKPSKASDQYSLAVAFCQLRTGRLPFVADDMMALIFKHLQEPPELLAFDSREAKVLEKALAKNPDERWENCQTFVAALRQASEDPILNKPQTTIPFTVGTLFGQHPTDEPQLEAGTEWNDNSLNLPMIWCPRGPFRMGSPKNESYRDENEEQVQVILSQGFWLGKFAVTQAEWLQVMDSQPWKGERYGYDNPRFPVTNVSWDDAIAFCQKLTEQERQAGRLPDGWEYTLPTEAQWESACRAGTATAYSFGDDFAQLPDFEWFRDNAYEVGELYAHAVGTKKPNPWGLFDMHGNVSEWCRDGYVQKLRGGPDPEAASEDSRRVYRGGSWNTYYYQCRSAFRYGCTSTSRSNNLGFRVARVLSSH